MDALGTKLKYMELSTHSIKEAQENSILLILEGREGKGGGEGRLPGGGDT